MPSESFSTEKKVTNSFVSTASSVSRHTNCTWITESATRECGATRFTVRYVDGLAATVYAASSGIGSAINDVRILSILPMCTIPTVMRERVNDSKGRGTCEEEDEERRGEVKTCQEEEDKQWISSDNKTDTRERQDYNIIA